MLVLGGGACKKAPESAVSAAGPVDLLAWAPPAQEITYERQRVVGAVPLPAAPVREVWMQEIAEDEGRTYRIIVGVDEEGARKIARRLRYAETGLVVVSEGTVGSDGTIEYAAWEPPEVLLPTAALTAGAQAAPWSGEHQFGDWKVTRSCEIQWRSEQCEGDGLIVVCDAEYPEFRLATRDHFCRGTGWSGYESLVSVADRPSVRTWTESLQRLD